MFIQHPRQLYTWTYPESPDRLHLNCTKMENMLDELSHVSRSRLRHRSPVARGNSKRQRQNSILTLHLEELKVEKAAQFAKEVTNSFTTLEAAQDAVTPEDMWNGTKRVLLEVARDTIRFAKLQKKKKWIFNETFAAIREKREAKSNGKNHIKY